MVFKVFFLAYWITVFNLFIFITNLHGHNNKLFDDYLQYPH